jgi:hypothetical protein
MFFEFFSILITRTEEEVKAALSKLSAEQEKTNKEFAQNQALIHDKIFYTRLIFY